MLTAEQFAKLSVQEQVTSVLGNGNELLERIFLDNVVKLFQLENLYIEICYQQTTNRIIRVEVVQLENVVHLYESQINISDLFK